MPRSIRNPPFAYLDSEDDNEEGGRGGKGKGDSKEYDKV